MGGTLPFFYSSQRVNELLVEHLLGANQGDIAVIRNRRFRVAGFPAGIGRRLVAEGVNPASLARRVGRVPPRADLRKHLGDGVLQRILSQRGAMLILQRTGSEIPPSADVDGIRRTAAAVQSFGRGGFPI